MLDITEGRGTTSRPRGLAILVHGTRISARLARKGVADAVRAAEGSKPRLRHLKWFDDGSLFRKRAINPADFEAVSFAWTGRNSAVARDKAARDLGAMLDQKAAEQYDLIVLIGHSHGGNVILKSLDYISEDSKRCAKIGVITLGTTFIDIRWMKREKLLVAWWFIMSAIPLYFYFLSTLNTNTWHGFSAISTFDFICLLMTVSCFIVPSLYLAKSFLRFIKVFPGMESSNEPDQLRAKTYFDNQIPLDVIRSSYDEAYMLLSLNAILAQILNISLLMFFETFSRMMRILRIRKDKRIRDVFRNVIMAIFLTVMFPFALIYFQINEITLFSILFRYIAISLMVFSPLRLLYIGSFSILGLPGAGFSENEIVVDSVPDLHSRASVLTVTRRNPVFLAFGRHYLYEDERCIDRVKAKLHQLSIELNLARVADSQTDHAEVSIDN